MQLACVLKRNKSRETLNLCTVALEQDLTERHQSNKGAVLLGTKTDDRNSTVHTTTTTTTTTPAVTGL
jgi:hypothetical protein